MVEYHYNRTLSITHLHNSFFPGKCLFSVWNWKYQKFKKALQHSNGVECGCLPSFWQLVLLETKWQRKHSVALCKDRLQYLPQPVSFKFILRNRRVMARVGVIYKKDLSLCAFTYILLSLASFIFWRCIFESMFTDWKPELCLTISI